MNVKKMEIPKKKGEKKKSTHSDDLYLIEQNYTVLAAKAFSSGRISSNREHLPGLC